MFETKLRSEVSKARYQEKLLVKGEPKNKKRNEKKNQLTTKRAWHEEGPEAKRASQRTRIPTR